MSLLLLLLALPAAAQQLNENCTVTVLNRTAQVNASGFWQIPNIPSNQGPVRARAICTANGITTIGVSRWMNVPANGIVFSDDIVFEAAPPIPATLALSAPKTTLENIGETVQLSVMVTFADGSTRQINTAAEGTSYTTSNANVAAVSPGGLVTAVGSGTVIIGATNEGSLGLLRVSVSSTAQDTDRDGMPDDWERTYGLNPNDPSDATLDRDGDTLNNRAEFIAGTDPTRPDTDGDGVRDALEIETGSDPLDPNSVNLEAALQSIRTAPGAVVMVKNSVDETTKMRLRVEGVLRDGTIIDLTARSRGTSYATSNASVASLTLVDGEVFANDPGSATLTVANGTFSTVTPVFVSAFAPVEKGLVAIPGHANDVEVSGNFAYVAAGDSGLQVIDVSDRAQPRIVGMLDTSGVALTLRVAGTRAYVADDTGGLVIADISVPTQPSRIATVNIAGSTRDVAVAAAGDFAYAASSTSGLVVVSLATNRVVAQGTGAGRSVDVQGTLAILGHDSGVSAYDVTNPSSPVPRGSYPLSNSYSVRLRDNIAYVAQFAARVWAIDFSNPASPQFRGQSPVNTGSAVDVALFGDFLAPADAGSGTALPIVSATPAAMILRGTVPVGSAAAARGATGATLDRSFAYETATAINGVGRFANGAPTWLFIGQWRSLVDDFGNAPAVSVVPAPVEAGTQVTVTVNATDDIGVAGVTLQQPGGPLLLDQSAPYTFQVTVPNTGTQMPVVVRAADFGGNVGTASASLQIVPDTTPPVARVVSPLAGSTQSGGALINVVVEGTDAGPIASVEAFADGVSLGVAQGAAGSFPYRVPEVVGTVTLSARAVDHAGNVGNSQPVVINAKTDAPPVISSVSVSPSSQLFTHGGITITVNATDDFGISLAEFLVDGEVIGSRTATPYIDSYRIPPGKSQIVVTARVTDTFGHVVTSTPITRSVQQTSAVASLPLPGYANDVRSYGSHAYVAAGNAGVHVVDVSNPAVPVRVTTIDTPGVATRLELRYPYLFVADGPGGLQVISVADPAAPVIVSALATSGAAHDVFIRNDRIYIGTESGYEIVNIAEPRLPRRVFAGTTQRPVTSVAARIGALFLLMKDPDPTRPNDSLLVGVSVTNETSPTQVSSLRLLTGAWSNSTFDWFADTLYVASQFRYHVLRTPSATPTLQSTLLAGFTDVQVDGGVAILPLHDQDSSTNYASILAGNAEVGRIDFTSLGTYHGTALALTPELVYTTRIDQPFDPVRVPVSSNTVQSHLYIGRWRTPIDTGTIAPGALLRAPLNNTTVAAGGSLRIFADASDNVAVKSVQILVDGNVVAESSGPVEIFYTVPMVPAATTMTITAVATDFAGNIRTSTPVTVNVVPDTEAPVARVTTPANGRTVLSRNLVIAAEATDNVLVTQVDFLVNGSVIATDRTWPFEATYTLPTGTTTATIIGRATDPSGNVADSTPVVTSVVTPQLVSSVTFTERTGYDMDTDGRIAALAASDDGLILVDITDPAAPVVLSRTTFSSSVEAVRLMGNYAYVLVNSRLVTVDITNPAAPVALHSPASTFAHSLAITRLNAYTLWGSFFTAWDLSNPAAPVTQFNRECEAGDIEAQDARLVTGHFDLQGWNGNALWASRKLWDTNGGGVNDIAVHNGNVAAAVYPGNFVVTTNYDDKFAWLTQVSGPPAWGVDLLEDTMVTTGPDAEVGFFDFSNPRVPALRSTLDFGFDSISNVRLTPRYMLAFSINGRLYITRYRDFTDVAGIAPTVSVLPFSGTARQSRLFNIRADAADDTGVASVVFNVNGVDVYTDSIKPYEFNYLIPAGVTTLNVTARAVDYSGNQATSVPRSTTVSP